MRGLLKVLFTDILRKKLPTRKNMNLIPALKKGLIMSELFVTKTNLHFSGSRKSFRMI